MPSPFPGMNPYLDHPRIWHDFHQALLVHLREQLGPQVRPAFYVKIEEHVYIHELTGSDAPPRSRRLVGRGDLTISERAREEATTRAGAAVIAAPARAEILPQRDVVKVRRLEVHDRERHELVTLIELLSPINKRPGDDREAYLGKRKTLLRSPVHVIEIDLLRAGQRVPFLHMPDCDYCITVSRAEERPSVGVWPLRLRDPLPVIPVPLRSPHPDARLDLMAALHHVYDAAGYEDYAYEVSPDPPLHPADDAWAQDVLRGVRAS